MLTAQNAGYRLDTGEARGLWLAIVIGKDEDEVGRAGIGLRGNPFGPRTSSGDKQQASYRE